MPADVTVSNSNNDGTGSLREAMDLVDFFGSIYFDLNANDTIFLQEELAVYKDFKIIGDENIPTIISGNNENRVFNILSGRSPLLANLHVVNGRDSLGVGIYCDSYSNATLENLTIVNNRIYMT